MKDIKNSNIIKAVCYSLIPMLVLVIILNAISLMFYATYEEDFSGNYKGYENTDRFANDYLSAIQRSIRIAEKEKEYTQFNEKVKIDGLDSSENNDTIVIVDQERKDKIQYNFYSITKYDVLLVSPDGNIITNVAQTTKTDTLEEIKQYISSKPYYWKYDLKTIDTNIEKMQYEEIAYEGFEQIQDSGYEVYTALKEENTEFYAYALLYDFVVSTYAAAPSVILISAILLMICFGYIFASIGHKAGKEGIYTNGLDNILYEVVLVIVGILLALEIFVLAGMIELVANRTTKLLIDTGITVGILMGFVIYITLAIFGVTTIRRAKAHIFWKNTLIYRFTKFVLGGLFTNFSQTVKLAVEYGGFILASVILILMTLSNPIMVLFLLAFWYYIFKKILDRMNQMSKVREKINSMYRGDIEKPLKEDELYGELRQVARELNDISGGLSNALEEAMKSERLKTELITNVSHDIKTPLTSIINYVDLMKQEKIKDPKIQEYLEVLDSKSQRLKKLTEDLIEASKASSGNIKLTMENLNVKELVKQVRGEFEDRFSKKGLEIIETFPEEDVTIEADSRYLYRVMENMYVNISKYALENSRVYVDVTKSKGKVQIALKNISKDKLNISVDELMQRFVRGDESRTNEGSGLGISIAKSLTELQKGSFDIYLDGDLFKVVIEFKAI